MSWGDNGAARPTTDAYRSSRFWDRVEIKKIERRMTEIEELRANGDLTPRQSEELAHEYEGLSARLASFK